MPILVESEFKPAWWLNNPHLQTLWPALFRCPRIPPRHRERLPTPDCDFIDLDWCDRQDGPIIVLLHGLSGSSRSVYITGMQLALRTRGYASVALNFRGCSGHPNQTSRCYHSGDTDDLDYVYRHIKTKYPGRPIGAVGYSLGGNVLLKWLGEQGRHAGLFAAVAVSVPLLLHRCADRMDRGFSKLYRHQLLRELKDYIEHKRFHLHRIGKQFEYERLAELGDLSGIRSFWEYDDQVVARLYGFQGVNDYYEKSSSRQYLARIHCPTLLIQSRDDPFMTDDVLPQDEELSPSVILEITRGGGHVGFISGNIPAAPCYWLESRIPAFLKNHWHGLSPAHNDYPPLDSENESVMMEQTSALRCRKSPGKSSNIAGLLH